jgi:hypothetical protein
MRHGGVQAWVFRSVAAAISYGAVAAAPLADGPAPVADPGTFDRGAQTGLCCGVPQRDEVTADQVFGRWVVTYAPVGMPLRTGESVEFRRDGTLATARGACRYAVLRAELSVSCAGRADVGELRYEDDTKLIWRHDGREMIFVAPTD